MLQRLKVSSGYCQVTTPLTSEQDIREYFWLITYHILVQGMTLTKEDESPMVEGLQQVGHRAVPSEIFVGLFLCERTRPWL